MNDFYKNTVGKAWGTYDGDWVGQCVSLVIQYLIQVYGVKVTGGHGNAIDFRKGGVGGNWLESLGFEWLPAGTAAKDGDILVWGNDPGNWTGKYGHVAIWYKGKIYDQNFAGRRSAGLHAYFSEGYLGKWRKKAPTKAKPKEEDMKTDLTKSQWESFIKKVYKGFSARTPSASEVAFHMKNSNPLSFVNGFASYKWEADEKKLRTANADLKKAKSELSDTKKQLKAEQAHVASQQIHIEQLQAQLEQKPTPVEAPVERDSDNSPSTGNALDPIVKLIRKLLDKFFK